MLKYILRSSTLVVVLSLFSACKKDWNELGSQLITTENIQMLVVEDFEVKASIHPEDSLSSLNTSTSF